MAELAEKYRDRARERRDGKNPDYQAEDPTQPGIGGAYRAVAPDLKSLVFSSFLLLICLSFCHIHTYTQAFPSPIKDQ